MHFKYNIRKQHMYSTFYLFTPWTWWAYFRHTAACCCVATARIWFAFSLRRSPFAAAVAVCARACRVFYSPQLRLLLGEWGRQTKTCAHVGHIWRRRRRRQRQHMCAAALSPLLCTCYDENLLHAHGVSGWILQPEEAQRQPHGGRLYTADGSIFFSLSR